MKRNILNILLTIIWLPFGIILGIFSFPFWVYRFTKSQIYLLDYKHKNILVCKTSNGWFQFINNNVAPILSDNYLIAWKKRIKDPKLKYLLNYYFSSHVGPYIIKVNKYTYVIIPVYNDFIEYKSVTKASEIVQNKIQQILTNKILSN